MELCFFGKCKGGSRVLFFGGTYFNEEALRCANNPRRRFFRETLQVTCSAELSFPESSVGHA